MQSHPIPSHPILSYPFLSNQASKILRTCRLETPRLAHPTPEETRQDKTGPSRQYKHDKHRPLASTVKPAIHPPTHPPATNHPARPKATRHDPDQNTRKGHISTSPHPTYPVHRTISASPKLPNQDGKRAGQPLRAAADQSSDRRG